MSGEVADIEFPLSEICGSPVRIHQLVARLSQVILSEGKVLGEFEEPDVLQAIAILFSLRVLDAGSIGKVTNEEAFRLMMSALDAVKDSDEYSGPVGHA